MSLRRSAGATAWPRLWAAAAIAIISLLLALLPAASALVSTGVVSASKSKSFVYLDKFCFDFTPRSEDVPGGAVEITVTAADPKQPIIGLEGLQFWMFDDEDSSWPAMRYGRMDCEQRSAFSRGEFAVKMSPAAPPNATAIALSPLSYDGVPTGQMVYRRTLDISQHIRPRFWWFGLVHCGGPFGNVRWRLHMYNTYGPHAAVEGELGVDQRRLPRLTLLFFALFCAICAAHVWGLWSQRAVLSATERSNFKVHQVVQLFTASLFIMTLALGLKLVHWTVLTRNGAGLPLVERIGDVVCVVARVQLTMLIMLLGSGWTISAPTLAAKRTVLAALGLFGLLYIALTVVRFLTRDTNHVWVPTALVAVLNVLTAAWVALAAWFVLTVFKSWRREYKPHKRTMYLRLGVVYSFWLLCEPCVVLLTQLLSPWVREWVLACVETPLAVVAWGWMAWLLWPSRSARYFTLDLPDIVDDFDNPRPL